MFQGESELGSIPEYSIAQMLGQRLRESLSDLSLADLKSFVNDEEIVAEATKLYAPDLKKPYGRNVVFAENELEAMVATWTPGLFCAPHDHGGSAGAVRILQGRARHTLWRVHGEQLVKIHEHDAVQGDTLCCEPNLIHSLGDAGAEDGSDGALKTLHMYTASIEHMVVYDLPHQRTLIVNGSCGAWVPHDEPAMIIGEIRGIHAPKSEALTALKRDQNPLSATPLLRNPLEPNQSQSRATPH